MSQKIVKLSYWLVPILLVCFSPVILRAQEKATEEKQETKAEKKASHSPKTVTGCLQKGDEPDEFTITGEDGKTWGLRSSDVKLADHVGHKVTVTGTLKAESYEKEKGERDENEKKEAVEASDIRVTNLKMVSDTCK